MQSLRSLQDTNQFLRSFREFTRSYQELTVMQMQARREAIILSRAYNSGLLDVFVDLKQSMRQLAIEEGQEEVFIQLTTSNKNGKTVAVLLSFETRFSGHLNRKVFQSFTQYLAANTDVEIVIVGQVGKQLFDEHYKDQSYDYFPITEKSLSDEELQELFAHILQYQHVNVFNPHFKSLINQEAQTVNLTGDIPVDAHAVDERKRRRFLYEPQGEHLLGFFEVQIFLGLLKQTIRETLLAILGARITTLESTQSNIEHKLAQLELQEKKLKKAAADSKQRQRLAGMSLWQ